MSLDPIVGRVVDGRASLEGLNALEELVARWLVVDGHRAAEKAREPAVLLELLLLLLVLLAHVVGRLGVVRY